MSTRSGKRIHGLIDENAADDVPEVKSKSKKTRGKCLKENCNEIASEKKRKHYVRYPSEEDLTALNNTDSLLRSSRKSQRNTLREHNIVATDSEASNDDRTARHTRRTRKTEAADTMENIEPSKEAKTKIKGKNNKKNKILNDENIPEQTIKKKSNKKKKQKSGPLVVDDNPQTNDDENNLSNMSIDSFHSAAGSPIKDYNEHIANNIEALHVPSKSTRSHDKVLESVDTNNQIKDMQSRATRSKIHSVKNLSLEDDEIKTRKNKDTKRKRKLKNESTNDEDVSNSSKVTVIEAIFPTTDSNETQYKHTDSFNNSDGFNNSLKNSNKNNRSKIQSTNDKNDNLLIFEIENVDNVKTPNKLNSTKETSTDKNSTYDEINVSETDLNATFDKESSYNSINQNDQPQGVLTKITKNSLKQKKTYDKTNVSETNNLNSTFHKEISYECGTQFDHPENDFNNVNGTGEQTDITRNKKKIDSACDKTNCDTVTNLNETEITNVSNNHSKLTLENSTNINNSQNSNRKKIKSSYFKINFSETSLNVIDEEMPENSINKSKESQNVITNDIKNSDKKKIKSSIRKSISNMIDASIINLDGTYEKDDSNLTQQKALRKSIRLSKYSLDQDVSSNMNATYDKSTITDSQPNSRRNSTFDITDKINTTFEMVKSTKLDATFDKSKKYDVTRRGSSLISSDNTNNTSSETSKDISRISITSDESMADNIVNVTPVLIESSIDASQTNISSFEHNKSIKENAETKNATNVTEIKTSRTPLKREGTYTEIQYATPPKHEGMFTEYKSTTTPKGKETFTVTKSPNTPIREGTYTELKSAITPLKREGTYTDLNPITTPSKKNEINIEISLKTPLKVNGVIESKDATPPLKREGTFTKDSDVSQSPKLQPDVNKTPTRRKSTELKSAITPLKRERTYTDLNPITTPSKKNEINIEINPKIPPKLNEVIEIKNATPPLKREGTFTKDSDVSESPKLQPDVNKTPTRRKSIEKSRRRSSVADLLPRATKVMFCNPVVTPVVVRQMKGKLIKSNLKGSDKSFVFDECVSDAIRPPRKRSYTQSEAEAISSKRKRLTPGQQQSVEHLSRRRTTSASGKLQDPGTSSIRVSTANKSKTEVTPSKSKPEDRVLRTKLPNFAALHQKQFAKMESLAECQERKAKRARQLLTPTGSVNMLERISPKETPLSPTTTELQPQAKIDTPNTSIIPPEYQGSTRFGFKLNTSVNPFSFPSKTETKPKINRESRIKPLKRQAMLPSLAGATNLRKEVAKQTVLREKSFIEKRDMKRVENRTIIKGVRTNRRFELQMKMRNVK